MKTSYCKGRYCMKLGRRYNKSCQQFCGPFYCMLTQANVKDMQGCPRDITNDEYDYGHDVNYRGADDE